MPTPSRNAIATIACALLPLTAPAAAPGNPKQDENAALAYRQRAEKGDADAALQLGNLLARGRVSATRYGDSITWYKKGCTLGSVSACHNAGASYHEGRNGVTVNYAEAANYYLQAADRAFLPSMYNLVVLYAESRITSIDNREGLKWLLVAQRAAAQCPAAPVCKLILEDRAGYRTRLDARLSAEERREAQELAETWQPKR